MEVLFGQNWQYSKKYPKGKPIFFKAGKRIPFEQGIKLAKDGVFGELERLKEWIDREDA